MPVAAPPSNGKSNREMIRWLSKALGASGSNVWLIVGYHSALKAIEITGMTQAEIITASSAGSEECH